MVMSRVPVVLVFRIGGFPVLVIVDELTLDQVQPEASTAFVCSKMPYQFKDQEIPTNRRRSTSPPAIRAWTARCRRTRSARRACCRSILARASLRSRSLLEATGAPLQHSSEVAMGVGVITGWSRPQLARVYGL